MQDESVAPQPDETDRVEIKQFTWRDHFLKAEDSWAIYMGAVILACSLGITYAAGADAHPLKGWFAKPGSWQSNPLDAFTNSKSGASNLWGLGTVFLVSLIGFGVGLKAMGTRFLEFLAGFWFVFLLATIAYVLAGQHFVKQHNLEYALWALGIGLLISNTVGTPKFVMPAVRTEFFIKTGLILLGAEVLISKLVLLGPPGIYIAWVVTPVVLISTYIFGQKVLKMESKSLNMVISADMSVCGVSAAIATAAACRAKKEELSFAIGLSLSFTVIMMIVMPVVIKALGLSPVIGGAWLGGTIDSTGAVTVAAELLGDAAKDVAITIKLIQNILIGVTAFGVASYWVSFVDRSADSPKPRISEIWNRFPKFIVGFIAASLLYSWIDGSGQAGAGLVSATKGDCTKVLRGWFFCLAFVCIGLETNFRHLLKFLKGSKPLVLYVCGQSLNLILTLTMSWIMFQIMFKDLHDELLKSATGM